MTRPVLELVAALLIAAICVAGYFEAIGYRAQSAYLPTAVMVLGLVLSLIWALQCLLQMRRKRPEPDDSEPDAGLEPEKSINWGRFVLFVGAGLVYAVLVPVVGYFTMTLVFIPALSFALGYRNKKVLLASPMVFIGVLYVLFIQVLQVPLPDELILQMLGAY